jgi:hypothetical protein
MNIVHTVKYYKRQLQTHLLLIIEGQKEEDLPTQILRTVKPFAGARFQYSISYACMALGE